MRKTGFYLICLIFCFASTTFGEKIVILNSQNKSMTPYGDAVEGFKNEVRKYHRSAVFLEFSSVNRNYIENIKDEKPDLIFTLGTSGTRALAERIKDIPIVFSLILYPQANSINGKNITGVSLDIPVRLQFNKIKSLVPGAKRIAVIFSAKDNGAFVENAESIARNMGLLLDPYEINSVEELPKIKEMRSDIIWLIPDVMVCQQSVIRHILHASLMSKIPVFGISPNYVKAGAVMALSCDYDDIGRQSGGIAIKILEGAPPSDIPVEAPRKVKTYLNMTVAEELGISITHKDEKDAAEVYKE
jgi:putative tryptophan/tyrosine transport system substrate-binding protein